MDVGKINEFAGGKFDIHVYKTLASTNTTLREMANGGCDERTVVIADGQSAGRGRMGHDFSSPSGTGLYMSVLIRPRISAERSVMITVAAAVAAARAIEEVSGDRAEIKWVNDIYVGGKKVCGILAESVFGAYGNVEYTVLGIGVNVFLPHGGFDESISDIAGALFDRDMPQMREKLAALMLEYIDLYVKDGLELSFDEYRERQMLIGKRIYVIRNGENIPATAVSVDDSCRLVVKYDNGDVEALSSGDVSTRRL